MERLARFVSTLGLASLLGSGWKNVIRNSISGLPTYQDQSRECLSMFVIVGNEMFFLPAFLDHHRQIGVQRFLILVDRSDDGTLDFLNRQSDVVVLTWRLQYGTQFNIHPLAKLGREKFARAGVLVKRVVTDEVFSGKWGIVLDADEFLFLPQQFSRIQEAIEDLPPRTKAVAASVVEFFPENLTVMSQDAKLATLDLLTDRYGFFEKVRMVQMSASKWPVGIGTTKARQLALALGGTEKTPASARIKTPLIRFSDRTYLVNSHHASRRPSSTNLLTIGHFTFTSQIWQKTEDAIRLNQYANQSIKYRLLAKTFDAIESSGGSLLGPNSERFQSVKQFVEAGLMVWRS
jgi:hypothetical protein